MRRLAVATVPSASSSALDPDRMIRSLGALVALTLFVVPYGAASAQRASDSLEIGFRNPPASARPRTWWHWTQSNVTKEGITKEASRGSSSPT
jgi:hypothetical protein